MKIAVTGATGFVGQYLARRLISSGHRLACWFRDPQRRDGLDELADAIDWIPGQLDDPESAHALVAGCEAVVHAAFWRPGKGFRGAEGDIVEFARINILGTLRLIEAARQAGIDRFVFISTCAVHERILDDRPLDEAHPLWPLTHYGAHKAALEKFVHSYGFGQGMNICALRPTGVYGLRQPVEDSKWYPLVADIVAGRPVQVAGGGKEVHAQDVARAAELLLAAPGVAGQSYACYDRYVSEFEVAEIARELAGSQSRIEGALKTPKHQIVTDKIQSLGMTFGGTRLLRQTIGQLVERIRKTDGAG